MTGGVFRPYPAQQLPRPTLAGLVTPADPPARFGGRNITRGAAFLRESRVVAIARGAPAVFVLPVAQVPPASVVRVRTAESALVDEPALTIAALITPADPAFIFTGPQIQEIAAFERREALIRQPSGGNGAINAPPPAFAFRQPRLDGAYVRADWRMSLAPAGVATLFDDTVLLVIPDGIQAIGAFDRRAPPVLRITPPLAAVTAQPSAAYIFQGPALQDPAAFDRKGTPIVVSPIDLAPLLQVPPQFPAPPAVLGTQLTPAFRTTLPAPSLAGWLTPPDPVFVLTGDFQGDSGQFIRPAMQVTLTPAGIAALQVPPATQMPTPSVVSAPISESRSLAAQPALKSASLGTSPPALISAPGVLTTPARYEASSATQLLLRLQIPPAPLSQFVYGSAIQGTARYESPSYAAQLSLRASTPQSQNVPWVAPSQLMGAWREAEKRGALPPLGVLPEPKRDVIPPQLFYSVPQIPERLPPQTFLGGVLIYLAPVLVRYECGPRYVVRRPRRRRFTVSNVTYLQFDPKAPDEAIKLSFDFLDDLPDGVVLGGVPEVSVTVIRGIDPNPSALFNGVAGVDPTLTKVVAPVQGGVDGCIYQLHARIPTSDPLTILSLTGWLPVSSTA